MKKAFLSSILLMFAVLGFANKEVIVTCSEMEAKIYANGEFVGTSGCKVLVKSNSVTFIKIELSGFMTISRELFNDKDHAKLDKSYHFTLFKDDKFDASVSSNIANENVSLKSNLSEDKAWKVISEVVTTYFDILEVSDKSTGYIRTAYIAQNFKFETIRTRVIIKGSSSDSNSSYKIKIISEVSDKQNADIKNDELFKPWNRVLKKYENLVKELEDRLNSK